MCMMGKCKHAEGYKAKSYRGKCPEVTIELMVSDVS